MSQIPVKTITSSTKVLHRLARLMQSVHAEIRARMLQRFGPHREGHEVEDWLAAEGDVLYSPPCTLAECSDEIHLRAAVPCVDANSLRVDVMPDSITIEGRMPKTKATPDEKVHLREFGGAQLLRQFDLPARIDPKDAKATLQNGLLDITVKKIARERASPIGRSATVSPVPPGPDKFLRPGREIRSKSTARA